MKRKAATGLTVTLLLLLAIAIYFYNNFQAVVVSGNSMEPTYKDGDKLWASKAYWLVGQIKKKDVVVLKTGDTAQGYIIKRVYGLGGDVIDWKNVPESYSLANGEYRVPAGQVYVLGDNRDVSEDSRALGPFPESQIIGRIVAKR